MADTSQILNDAYQYIEDGDFQAARDLLESHREANEENPDFWWVYAHAVETNEEGREALQRLLELDPDYPGARTLLSQIAPPPAERTSATAPPLPPLDDMGFGDDDFDDFSDDDFTLTEPETARRSSMTRNLLVGAFVVIALLLVGVLLLPSLLSGTPDATPTRTIAEQPTARPIIEDITEVVSPEPSEVEVDESTPTEMEAEETETQRPLLFATETELSEATDEPTSIIPEEETEEVAAQGDDEETETAAATPTREAVPPTETPSPAPAEDTSFGLDAEALQDAGVPEDGVTVEETTLGDTLVFTVCATPGPQASAAIADVLEVLIAGTDDITEVVEAYGFSITDCDTGNVFRTIGVAQDAFEDSEGSVEEIQGLLRPIN